MKKVIVAGYICLDITLAIPEMKVRPLGDLFQSGKVIHMELGEDL